MTRVTELFGYSTAKSSIDWKRVINQQTCPYAAKRCFKCRKSKPDVAIGTCSVAYSNFTSPIIICPNRLLERKQIFTDCLHLLNTHEPGNELHIVPEVSIPGGSVDYFLVSVRKNRIKDFVGIELQTLDTTGTLWPLRQQFLYGKHIVATCPQTTSFGMNWKMTAKTILMQLHHKISTFEANNKHLVLIIQDCLLSYFKKEFQFAHLNAARLGDAMHVHSYTFTSSQSVFRINLDARLSTDADGIATCLGLHADPNVELLSIIQQLEAKISEKTLFSL